MTPTTERCRRIRYTFTSASSKLFSSTSASEFSQRAECFEKPDANVVSHSPRQAENLEILKVAKHICWVLVAKIEVIHTTAAKPKPQRPLHHQNPQFSTQHRQRTSDQNPSNFSIELLQLLFFDEYQFEAVPPEYGGVILITKQRLQKSRSTLEHQNTETSMRLSVSSLLNDD